MIAWLLKEYENCNKKMEKEDESCYDYYLGRKSMIQDVLEYIESNRTNTTRCKTD